MIYSCCSAFGVQFIPCYSHRVCLIQLHARFLVYPHMMKYNASDLRPPTAGSSTAQYEIVGLFLALSDSRGDQMKDTTLHYDGTAVVDFSY